MREDELLRAHGVSDLLFQPSTRAPAPAPAVLDHVRRVDGHWVWAGSQTIRGHGVFEGKPARRAVWEAANGPLPAEVRLVQTCDLSAECLLHLQPVSQDEALRMMTAARRAGVPARTTVRQAEFRARRVHAISTSIPHVESSPVPVVRRLSTAVHAQSGQLSTGRTVHDYGDGFDSGTTREEERRGDER